MAGASPLLFERFELKYHIPLEMVEEVSRFAAIYCDLDYYSQISNDNFYIINNLYLDTPNYLFLERRLAKIDDRFNLRIRSYGEKPVMPYFFEIKWKKNGIVKKRRCKVKDEHWRRELDGYPLDNERPSFITDYDDYRNSFVSLVHSYNARPKVFTQYRRKAFASNIDEYARVTIDKDLRFMRQDQWCLEPNEEMMINYDNPTRFLPDCNVVLELKCTTAVPKWFIDMISYFNLDKQAFSKYVSGVMMTMDDDKLQTYPRQLSEPWNQSPIF